METFYGISITHSLSSEHIACQKNGAGRGSEEAKLKKQEKAETSKFIEDLHHGFKGFFHLIFPDFLN